MLPSYEAIYDHGRLTWIGEDPGSVKTRVIVTPIRESTAFERPATDTDSPNGNHMADLLTEMAAKGIGKIFGDPLEWQKEVRKDRPLPGREEE